MKIFPAIALVSIATFVLMAESGHVYAQPHEQGAFTIITASPEPDTRGIDTNSRIGVTFSKSIDISSLNNSTVIVYIVGEFNDVTVHGELTYDSDTNTAYFIPDGELSYSTNYRIVVTPDVKDTEGNNLTSEYIWEFTTKNAFGGCGGS
ncbi:MAG: Ig-like domain-containing protein [Nitrospirota bacterium]